MFNTNELLLSFSLKCLCTNRIVSQFFFEMFYIKLKLHLSFSLKSLTPTNKVMRDGAFVSQVPTVAGPVSVSLYLLSLSSTPLLVGYGLSW